MFNFERHSYAAGLAFWLAVATIVVFLALANALERMSLTWPRPAPPRLTQPPVPRSRLRVCPPRGVLP